MHSVSLKLFLECCTCPRKFYAAWFEKDPYVDENEDGTMGGIFPKFLNNMIANICSGCTGLRGGYENSPSEIYWDRSKDGRSPKRDSKYPEFHLDIQKNFHRIFMCINFPEAALQRCSQEKWF